MYLIALDIDVIENFSTQLDKNITNVYSIRQIYQMNDSRVYIFE